MSGTQPAPSGALPLILVGQFVEPDATTAAGLWTGSPSLHANTSDRDTATDMELTEANAPSTVELELSDLDEPVDTSGGGTIVIDARAR